MKVNLSSFSFGKIREFKTHALGSRIDSTRENWPRALIRGWKKFWGNLESTLKEKRDYVNTFFEKEISGIKKDYLNGATAGEEHLEKAKEDAIEQIEVKILLLESGSEDGILKIVERQAYMTNTLKPTWEKLSSQITKYTQDESGD